MSDTYNRLYQKARAQACQALIAAHHDEFKQLLHRKKHELGLRHRHTDLNHEHEDL